MYSSYVLPQISQILTDGACLDFCEFCVFCGTSHAPVNLCKSVQSVGGLFSTLLQNRLVEMFSHRIHRIHRTDLRIVLPQNSQNSQNRLAEMSSHRFHRFSQNRLAEMFSHRIHGIHRTDWQRCSPTDFTEFTEQTGRDVLPQISRILTDGACLEFCEFCVFCGTSYAPSESVKICEICGRIILAAWVWQGCHTLL